MCSRVVAWARGGRSPTAALLEAFPASPAMRGEDEFVLSVLYRPHDRDAGAEILSAGNPALANGFRLYDFYGELQFRLILANGTNHDVGYASAFSWYGVPGYRFERDALLVFRVTQTPNTRIQSWVNGMKALEATAASGGVIPGSNNFRVGSRGYSVGAGVSGVAYKSGTVTDAEIREFSEECNRSKNLVGGVIAWDHRYTMADSPAGATWNDLETGSPVHLARAGAQMVIETRLARWA